MNRRTFLSVLGGSAAIAAPPGLAGAVGENAGGKHYGVSSTPKAKRIDRLAGRSIGEIRDFFKREFFEKTLPLWKKDAVDWKNGGYHPAFYEKGAVPSRNKRLYYQGRILWLYSYFYNHIEKENFHLRAAKAGYDFLTKYGVDEKCDWFTEITPEGKPVEKFFDIYASIFTILGLGEYFRATGDSAVRDLAVKSAFRVTEIILSPHYQAPAHGPWYEPGTKRMGTWLHHLSTLTPLLKYTSDDGLDKIAQMCVRNILQYHWQPRYGLSFEVLRPDMTPHPNDFFIDAETRTFTNQPRQVNNFHSMEAGWMIMDEALRRGNRGMFTAAMDFGRSHLEKSWVDERGRRGLVQFFRPDEPESFKTGPLVLPYVMQEVFIMLLLAIEHTGAHWAVKWFDRVFEHSYGKEPLEWPWYDTLHFPRGLMFCCDILNRMVEREGKMSEFMET
jgi:mannose/cellobiose epimerase-like protein (N-acyl-D-glucosamine 2-epimerase family)